MLSPDERREIEEELAHYGTKRAACVEAMMVVQRHRGWVSDEALRDVAALLEMTAEELDSVATFYSLLFRKPVGRHVILACDSISCWVKGTEQVRAHLTGRLGIGWGETTPDGRFTLLPAVCLGACDRAPAMMIDEELFGNLDAEKIDAILAGYEEETVPEGRAPKPEAGKDAGRPGGEA
jgi:NADH-quinone oxidoreductase subunit E